MVYSSVSNVTWTKDANLLGTLFATQGFNTVVNAIIAASPTINNTPNFFSPSGTYTLTASDFSSNGQTSWFGAMGYVTYLNSISYAGSTSWRLPTVANLTSGTNTATNGTAKGDELVELNYQELGGTAWNSIPNTATFNNEQAYSYWSGTEDAPNPSDAWDFVTVYGYQFNHFKTGQLYAWAVSSGQVASLTPVPEAGSTALMLVGLGVAASVVRRQKVAV